MRSLLYLSLLALSNVCLATIQFINPAPFADTTDFGSNAVYPEGSLVNCEWTQGQGGTVMSLTMFQLNGTEFMQPFELVSQNMPSNATFFSWTVGTAKNLSFSNVFMLSIFLEGETLSAANSHYFNITSKNTVSNAVSSTAASTSTTASASASTSTTRTSSTMGISTTPPAAPSESTSSSQNSTSTSSPSVLSSAAKAGIGIGVSVAIVLGIAVGWLIFGRKKVQNNAAAVPMTNVFAQYNLKQQTPEKWGEQRYQLPGESMQPRVHELSDTYFPR